MYSIAPILIHLELRNVSTVTFNDYYAPPLLGGGIKRCFCLTSVCLTSVCLSVAYIGPKSRTEMPRKTKIGTEVAHVSRTPPPWRSKGQRSRSPGRFANHASVGCSGGRENMCVGTCCYVAVCSAAEGTHGGGEGGGIPSGADLTGGHSCSGWRGPWEAGPWRPGPRGPRKAKFWLAMQSPDCNLNWINDLFKLETNTLIRRSVLSEF